MNLSAGETEAIFLATEKMCVGNTLYIKTLNLQSVRYFP
jgi:hypothetical protein